MENKRDFPKIDFPKIPQTLFKFDLLGPPQTPIRCVLWDHDNRSVIWISFFTLAAARNFALDLEHLVKEATSRGPSS